MRQDKSIQDLEAVTGPLLFFGGVYSNLQALQALQKWAHEQQFTPDRIFCTGDMFAYCAQPLECAAAIRQWGIHCIAGNVELQLRNDADDCGCDFTAGGRCDLFSKNWYRYLHTQINGEVKQWLHTLPNHIRFTCAGKKIAVVHGSFFNTAEYIFGSTPWPVKAKNFAALDCDMIIAGHCGLPFADVAENKLWLNAGVIGVPANDGTPRVWFATLEKNEDGLLPRFHHYTYNHLLTQELMYERGLPKSYAETLQTGIWDNCEILPPAETLAQGKPISFGD